MPIIIAYSDEYLRWEGSHASPRRAALAVQHILQRAEDEKVEVRMIDPGATYFYEENVIRNALTEIHESNYVDTVLTGELAGHRDKQGMTAAIMFNGTYHLVHAVEQDEFAAQVYFNPQGAKHHAGYDYASGFCVFNDMAWAAQHFATRGKKVAYLDWDAHHGDGVEFLTQENPNILTASIHQGGIFPGTGQESVKHKNVFNYPLWSGAGDAALTEAVDLALAQIEAFKPDVLLLAAGADGHEMDPLAQLDFSMEGFAHNARAVGEFAAQKGIPVLVGGAGGYTPFTYTPIVWAEVIRQIDFALRQQRTVSLTRPMGVQQA